MIAQQKLRNVINYVLFQIRASKGNGYRKEYLCAQEESG
nr:MAG TPA_asm: hypothetical protein [Caudoviricetes sp.]